MTIDVYGETDLFTLFKILENGGYKPRIINFNNDMPYCNIFTAEIKEKENEES